MINIKSILLWCLILSSAYWRKASCFFVFVKIRKFTVNFMAFLLVVYFHYLVAFVSIFKLVVQFKNYIVTSCSVLRSWQWNKNGKLYCNLECTCISNTVILYASLVLMLIYCWCKSCSSQGKFIWTFSVIFHTCDFPPAHIVSLNWMTGK